MAGADNSINILVLGVGGNVSQGIVKALRKTDMPIRILGACISEYSKGLYMCDEGYISPLACDESFLPWVIDFCNEHNVSIILTGVEEIIIELAKNIEVLKANTKAKFISSTYDQLIIGQDKFLTCEFLKNNGCNYPEYELWQNVEKTKAFAEKYGFPIIAKPRHGKSSSGIFVMHSFEDIDSHPLLDNYVIEKCIGNIDSEYTVGCYVGNTNKDVHMIIMKRKLSNGTTVWAKTVEDQKIADECTRICKAFNPIGPFNIQLRVDGNGDPCCFELNVRFSGTTAIRNNFGFQDVKAMINEYVYGYDISDCFELKSGEVFRYDEEFYLEEGSTSQMQKEGLIRDISNCSLK